MNILIILLLLVISVTNSSTLIPNTFYLVCYKKEDLKCIEAEREVNRAYEILKGSKEYSMISRELIPRFELVECLQG